MNKRYYAAVLIGDEPKVIKDVYAFQYSSQKEQWLTERYFPEGERVSIISKIAKKHKVIEVEFRTARRLGASVWVWVYNGIPDWLYNTGKYN